MAKQIFPGDILILPKNFPIREHRNTFAKVLKVNGTLLTLETFTATFQATTEDVSAKRALNVNQRWDILNRDGFRCRVCGHHADNRRTLHVDHARAFSNGGKTEDLDNLWTLCSLCNSGKGSLSIEKINNEPYISGTELSSVHGIIENLSTKVFMEEKIKAEELAEFLDLAKKMLAELRRWDE